MVQISAEHQTVGVASFLQRLSMNTKLEYEECEQTEDNQAREASILRNSFP